MKNLLKLFIILGTLLMMGTIFNGCATSGLWAHKKTSVKQVGCTASRHNYPSDAVVAPIESIQVNSIYFKNSKLKFIGMSYTNDDGALLVEVPEGYFPILDEIFNTPANTKIKSITAYTLHRRTLDNTRSNHFALDIIFSRRVHLKSYKKQKSYHSPIKHWGKNGSICYRFGTVPNKPGIVILENYNFSLSDWTPLPIPENQKITLNFYETVQKRHYSKPLPVRVVLTPFAFAFDVITYPVLLLALHGGGFP